MVRPLVVLLALLALPTVQAGMQVNEIRHPDGILAPETGELLFAVDVLVDCTSVVARTGAAADTTPITAILESPPSVVLSGPTTIAVSRAACASAGTSVLTTFEWKVAATRAAPGMQPIPIRAAFELTANAADQVAPVEAESEVTVGPYLLLQSQVSNQIRKIGGDSTAFSVSVTNYGNIATRLDVLAEADHGTIVDIEPIVIGRGESDTLSVQYRAPGGSWDRATIEVTLQPSSDGGGTGDPIRLNMLVANHDFIERNIAGPDMLLMPVLVALALVVRGRRAA